MNHRYPGTAINTSTAFPSTPNLQSARGSGHNVPLDQGNTINSSNSSLHTFNNLISHKNVNAVSGAPGHSQSFRQLSGGAQAAHPHAHGGLVNCQSNLSTLSQGSSQAQVIHHGQPHLPNQHANPPHNAKTSMKISVNQNNRKTKQQPAAKHAADPQKQPPSSGGDPKSRHDLQPHS